LRGDTFAPRGFGIAGRAPPLPPPFDTFDCKALELFITSY